ncbi:hypothetical protein C8Q77DRAFT_806863 [Trametes polyzona]|nr:hypothetical protein C8Q77DRAFT_806863 [Trametes polyzona]
MSSVISSAAPGSAQPGIDVAVVMELLGSMKSTYGTLNQSLITLRDQGNRVKDLGPTMNEAHERLKDVHRSIDEHDAARAARVATVKDIIRGELRDQALVEMRNYIDARIKAEVEEQTAQQVGDQLVRDHLHGTPLEAQVEAGRAQVAAMRAAVENSKARQENASITWSDMDRPFKDVVRPDGSKSPSWPANLTSLLAYTDEKVAQLGRDYELFEHKERAQNVNAFLAHIGVVAVRLYH